VANTENPLAKIPVSLYIGKSLLRKDLMKTVSVRKYLAECLSQWMPHRSHGKTAFDAQACAMSLFSMTALENCNSTVFLSRTSLIHPNHVNSRYGEMQFMF
jgi:hypothetical protein